MIIMVTDLTQIFKITEERIGWVIEVIINKILVTEMLNLGMCKKNHTTATVDTTITADMLTTGEITIKKTTEGTITATETKDTIEIKYTICNEKENPEMVFSFYFTDSFC
jgi:hypothetical protein